MLNANLLLLILSSIGVLNGLMLSMYFLVVIKPKELQNYFLGTLLLLLSIRIGKSVILYFLPDTTGIGVYLHVGLSAWFLIGPFLYFFIYYFVTKEPNKHLWKFHLALNLILLQLFNILFPFAENEQVWRFEGINITFIQILIYLILAGFVLNRTTGLLPQKGLVWKSKRSWVLCIYWGNALVYLAYFMTGLTSYILGAITFTFMLYLLISLLLMSANDRNEVLFKHIQKYGGRTIADETTDVAIQRLEKLFKQEEVFVNPELKLKGVAELLSISPAKLSQILNEKLDKSFSQFITEYRIEKAKSMLLENDHFTLEAIGYECGFKAKSTFFAAFKLHVGFTPAQFKKEVQK